MKIQWVKMPADVAHVHRELATLVGKGLSRDKVRMRVVAMESAKERSNLVFLNWHHGNAARMSD